MKLVYFKVLVVAMNRLVGATIESSDKATRPFMGDTIARKIPFTSCLISILVLTLSPCLSVNENTSGKEPMTKQFTMANQKMPFQLVHCNQWVENMPC